MENVLYKILDSLNFSFKNLSEMSSKSGPVPTDSRKKVVCDYCDKEFESRTVLFIRQLNHEPEQFMNMTITRRNLHRLRRVKLGQIRSN